MGIIKFSTVDETGIIKFSTVNEMGIDQMGVDQVGSYHHNHIKFIP